MLKHKYILGKKIVSDLKGIKKNHVPFYHDMLHGVILLA